MIKKSLAGIRVFSVAALVAFAACSGDPVSPFDDGNAADLEDVVALEVIQDPLAAERRRPMQRSGGG